MSVYISATAIKDYLSCSKKLYWRTNFPETAVVNEYMKIGLVVHRALEKYWNSGQKALEYIRDNLKNINDIHAIECLGNFLDYFAPLLSEEDEIEVKFKMFLGDDTYLIGKIDRISNGVVYDWKTARKPPKNIDKDIQFMIYYLAYKSMYEKAPNAVMYGALTNGNLINYTPDEHLLGVLQDEIIPEVVNALRNNTFYKHGVFESSTCRGCMYRDVCIGGL